MNKLVDYALELRGNQYRPIVIGGMGVDISTAALALEAARLGGVGHISDAMTLFVADKKFDLGLSKKKQLSNERSLDSLDKKDVKFNCEDIYAAQFAHVSHTISRKKGDGLVFINIMEKLSMGDPALTMQARLVAALDAGVDGITLSAGLHLGTLKLIESHPRFRDVLLGIIVSSERALKIFLKSAARVNRMPDYIVVEGPLAGGHLGFGEDWREHSLSTIVQDVIRLLRVEGLTIPVIPAGGVFTGADAVNFMELGASAVQVATRFTISTECGLPESVKQKYLAATEEEVVVTSVSPTGYPMRMLTSSPCLGSNVKPNCEAFGYILDKAGKCQYLDAYAKTGCDEFGKKLPVNDKICLCYHFSKHRCYTCGHYVYRLKDTTVKLPSGKYRLPTAEEVFNDYLYSEGHSIKLPELVSTNAPGIESHLSV